MIDLIVSDVTEAVRLTGGRPRAGSRARNSMYELTTGPYRAGLFGVRCHLLSVFWCPHSVLARGAGRYFRGLVTGTAKVS